VSLTFFFFVFGKVSKNKSDVCHVLCEELFILDGTHGQVDVDTEFDVVITDSVILQI